MGIGLLQTEGDLEQWLKRMLDRLGIRAGDRAQADVYTLATLPAAAAFPPGRIVYVSDGAAGQQARMSTGAAWINLG